MIKAWNTAQFWPKLSISGQILCDIDSSVQIKAGSKLVIQLKDLTSKSNGTKIIAEGTFNALSFPIPFNVTYEPTKIINGHIYVIDATILNEHNSECLKSDHLIAVNLLNPGRTTFVDITVRTVEGK